MGWLCCQAQCRWGNGLLRLGGMDGMGMCSHGARIAHVGEDGVCREAHFAVFKERAVEELDCTLSRDTQLHLCGCFQTEDVKMLPTAVDIDKKQMYYLIHFYIVSLLTDRSICSISCTQAIFPPGFCSVGKAITGSHHTSSPPGGRSRARVGPL